MPLIYTLDFMFAPVIVGLVYVVKTLLSLAVLNSIQLISVYFLNIRISQFTTTQSGFTEEMVASHG